jgi:hypothetical protein
MPMDEPRVFELLRDTLRKFSLYFLPSQLLLEPKISEGETVKIAAGKDGLLFNGHAVHAKAA